MSSPEELKSFLLETLKSYFASRPGKRGIERANEKLKQKARQLTRPQQVRVVAYMSKRVYSHVPEQSKFKKFAWEQHLGVDEETRKASERLKTISETSGIELKVGPIKGAFAKKKIRIP